MTMINVEFHMNEVIMPLIYIPDRKVRFHIYGEKIVAVSQIPRQISLNPKKF